MHRHVGGCVTVVIKGQPIEMAPIPWCAVLNEWRRPKRDKTPGPSIAAKQLQSVFTNTMLSVAPGDVVSHHRSCDVSAAAEESDVVLPAWFDLAG